MRLSGSVTIPKRPSTIGGLISWARGVNRALGELRDRKIVGSKPIRNTNSQPPFYPTLTIAELSTTPTYQLTMKKGWVSSTHWKYGVDSIKTFEVTSIPGDPDPVANALTVSSGTKVYCKLTENAYGEITAAAIENGSSWPESSAAELIAGNDPTGSAGTRYIRLCEVITSSGQVKVKVIHTGNIEHSAPVRVENTSNSMSADEARVVKEWNSTDASFDCRYLEGGAGIKITEKANSIEIKADPDYNYPSSHPWKATPNGDEFINIAPGEVLAARTSGAYPVYWEEISYAGGSVEVTAASGYILISMTEFENPAGNTNYGDTGLLVSPASFIVEFQTDMSSVSSSLGFPICKVELAAGVATVTKQILTHNPSPSFTFISPAP